MNPSEPPPPPPIVSAPPPPPVVSAPPPPPPVSEDIDAAESVWGVALKLFGVGFASALVLGVVLIGVLSFVLGSEPTPSDDSKDAAPAARP